MRKFQTVVSFTIIIAVTVVVLGLFSVRHGQQASEPAPRTEIDHPIMLCI